MLPLPNQDAIDWLESGEGMRYFRHRGPRFHRAMFALVEDRANILDAASTSNYDLDNFRLDPFWNVA